MAYGLRMSRLGVSEECYIAQNVHLCPDLAKKPNVEYRLLDAANSLVPTPPPATHTKSHEPHSHTTPTKPIIHGSNHDSNQSENHGFKGALQLLSNLHREGGSGYLPGKKLPMRGIVPAAERRGRLSQGRNAVVRRDDRPWSAGTIDRGPQGRNAVVRGAQGRNAVVRRARMPQGEVTI